MQIILIVEGEADLRIGLMEALGRDHLVVGVDSGTAAASILREQPVDVVLMDLATCAGDAFEVFGRVEAMRRRPSLVLLAEAGQVRRAVKMMRLGVSDWLERPCSVEDVGRAIREAAGSRKPCVGKTG